MDRPPFSSVLLEARRRRGWSQRQLGEHAGVPQSHIAKIEGGADARLSTVRRVMSALGYETEFRRDPRRCIVDPPEGSAAARARDFGIDMTSLLLSYDMSPSERFDLAVANANGLSRLLAR
jgi:transcriptional regulator with XRE-family HTH domain